MVAAGRLRPKNLIVPIEIDTPAIAAFGGNLFEGFAIGLETNHTLANASEVRLIVARVNIAPAVADRGIDPAVHSPAQVADDRVGVAGAEAGVELFDLVGLAVAVGITQP